MADDSFARIEIANLEGRAQSTRFRQKLLHSLHAALRSSETIIKDAIRADTGHTDSEIALEYTLAISELRTHYESLSLEEDLKNQRALENLIEGRTTIVIAHRLSTVRRSDRIVVLRDGQVQEEGTHDELILRRGQYWKLHKLQFEDVTS